MTLFYIFASIFINRIKPGFSYTSTFNVMMSYIMELLEKSTVHSFMNGYEKGKYHHSRFQK